MKNIHVHSNITPELSQKIEDLFKSKLVTFTATSSECSPIMGGLSWHRSMSLIINSKHDRSEFLNQSDLYIEHIPCAQEHYYERAQDQWCELPWPTPDGSLQKWCTEYEYTFISFETDDDILFIVDGLNSNSQDILLKEAGYEQYIPALRNAA